MVSIEDLQPILPKKQFKLLENALEILYHDINLSKDQIQQIEHELLTVYFEKPNFQVYPTTTCAILVYYYLRLQYPTFGKRKVSIIFKLGTKDIGSRFLSNLLKIFTILEKTPDENFIQVEKEQQDLAKKRLQK